MCDVFVWYWFIYQYRVTSSATIGLAQCGEVYQIIINDLYGSIVNYDIIQINRNATFVKACWFNKMYQQHKAVNICIYEPKMIVRQYHNLHVFHTSTSSTWLWYYHRGSLILYLWVLFCICLGGHVSWQGHTQHSVWFIGIHRWRSCIGTFRVIY